MKTPAVDTGMIPDNLLSGALIRQLGTFLILILFSVSGSAQQSDIAENVKVWAVPGEQKVRPNDRIENSNLVWSAEQKKITVAGAGNEHVPFQVVITTPVPQGWRPKAPDGFFVKASDLTSASGKMIRGRSRKRTCSFPGSNNHSSTAGMETKSS